MPTNQPRRWLDADPPEPDESAFAERVRKLTPDNPGFDAWLKKVYGHNPYLNPDNKVKVKRRNSNRPRRS